MADSIFQQKSVWDFVQQSPTAFLGNILCMTKAEFSEVQLGRVPIRLILGLEFPPQQTSDGIFFVGRRTIPQDIID
jgi:hypothetical protein